MTIDFDNIDQRILALPTPARNYRGLTVGKSHIVLLMEGPAVPGQSETATIHKLDLCTRKTEKVLEHVRRLVVSANGEKALYEQLPPPKFALSSDEHPHGTWMIKPVDALG